MYILSWNKECAIGEEYVPDIEKHFANYLQGRLIEYNVERQVRITDARFNLITKLLCGKEFKAADFISDNHLLDIPYMDKEISYNNHNDDYYIQWYDPIPDGELDHLEDLVLNVPVINPIPTPTKSTTSFSKLVKPVVTTSTTSSSKSPIKQLVNKPVPKKKRFGQLSEDEEDELNSDLDDEDIPPRDPHKPPLTYLRKKN
jgi:hypothetical protein